MLEWLQIAVGVIGAIGVICAFVMGYRAPRPTEPIFELRFTDPPDENGTLSAALIATNPGDRPILLRSLVIQDPGRGVYFLTDPASRGRSGGFEASDASDVLAIDLELPAEQASEIDFFVGRERASIRDLVVDVEFSTARLPSVVRSQTLRGRMPAAQPDRRRPGTFAGRQRQAATS